MASVTRVRVRLMGEAESGQREPGEAEAEFLQRPAPCDGLGQALGQFNEFVVHHFPFVLVCFFNRGLRGLRGYSLMPGCADLTPWLVSESLLVLVLQREEEVIQHVVGDLQTHRLPHVAGVAIMNAGPDAGLLYLRRRVAEAVERPRE